MEARQFEGRRREVEEHHGRHRYPMALGETVSGTPQVASFSCLSRSPSLRQQIPLPLSVTLWLFGSLSSSLPGLSTCGACLPPASRCLSCALASRFRGSYTEGGIHGCVWCVWLWVAGCFVFF